MLLKFFLSYDEPRRSYQNGSTRKYTKASTHNAYDLPVRQKTTFKQIQNRIATEMDPGSVSFISSGKGRDTLINIPDEVMFQLQVLAISEYMYCTYNLQTKKIGFGNTKSDAYSASSDYDTFKMGANIGFMSKKAISGDDPDCMINFHSIKDEEPEEFSFECPDVFYEQILNELKPFILFEKVFLFNNVTSIFKSEKNYLNSFIDNYYDNLYNNTEAVKYRGTSVPASDTKTVFHMFMEDDEDIFNSPDISKEGLNIMGEICLKIMIMTDETF